MREQLGARAFIKRMRENMPSWSEKMPEIPALMHDYLRKAVDGRIEVQYHSRELEKMRRDMNYNQSRTVTAIGGAAFLISAAITLGLDNHVPTLIMNIPISTWIFGGLGIALLLMALLGERD